MRCLRPNLHLDGKTKSGKTEADKRNVLPTTTTSSDWLPFFRFPLFRQGGHRDRPGSGRKQRR